MEAPAYCMICDRPINTGPICDDCNEGPEDDEGGEDRHLEMAYEDRFAIEDYHEEY